MADDANRSPDEVAAYLALTQVPGIAAARLRLLLAAFETAQGALAAPHGAIATLPGFSKAAATAIRAQSPAAGASVLADVARLGARVLLPGDADFPVLLGEIPEPPIVLYAWGDVTLLRRPAAALVGSRDHSEYGATAARLLAAGVARAAVVVSGMARGIDAVVHSAALDAGGGSVGVLGNGFGVIYPSANRALYERMVARGCLITEHPPGERPHVGAFPRRNRLISGLALATVVVEARVTSGALITVDAALQQGRAVLAVPGPITSLTSEGCNKLIQQGAKPALCAGDILEELGLGGFTPAPRPGVEAAAPPDLSPLQLSLWNQLAERRHIDALAINAQAAPPAVMIALTELELRGLVRQEPGMNFTRV